MIHIVLQVTARKYIAIQDMLLWEFVGQEKTRIVMKQVLFWRAVQWLLQQVIDNSTIKCTTLKRDQFEPLFISLLK